MKTKNPDREFIKKVNKIAGALEVKPQLEIYKKRGDIFDHVVLRILDHYRWPKDHYFARVRPVEFLNVPKHYYVGETEPIIFNDAVVKNDYWYCTLTNVVTVRHFDKGFNVWKKVTTIPYFVIDVEDTLFAIGAFIPNDKSITFVLDPTKLSDPELSELVQEAELNKKVDKKERIVNFKEFLKTLPDED